MRVFAAFPLPAAARASIAEAFKESRSREPHARWVSSAIIHLTVHFFGELPAEAVQGLKAVFDDASLRRPPIPARLGAPGQFPGSGHARVLWVGLDAGGEEMAEFSHQFEQRIAPLSSLGGPPQAWLPDARGFTPHITVARAGRDTIHDGWDEGVSLPHTDFMVEECVLFESLIGVGGSEYHPLAALRFLGGDS
jgi:RNA 2',3'-cyclic 3'-phosphodiesterase